MAASRHTARRGGALALLALLALARLPDAAAFFAQAPMGSGLMQGHGAYRSPACHAAPFLARRGATLPPLFSSDGGSGGGGGGDDEQEGDAGAWRKMLKMEGKDPASLPADLVASLQSGGLGVDALKAYLALLASPLNKPFLMVRPIRNRMMADKTFLEKCGIDIAVGGIAQFLAEKQQRGENFKKEADFVLAGMVTVVLANFASVYSAAPTVGRAAAAAGTGFFASCPDNMFQVVAKGAGPFSMPQRLGAVMKPIPQLFLVGFFAAAGGYLYAAGSVAYRKYKHPERSEDSASLPLATIGKISLAVGAYVAINTNLRYQVLAGLIEQRGIDVVFKNLPAARTAGSTVVRMANTYVGSFFIVAYLKALGLQKTD